LATIGDEVCAINHARLRPFPDERFGLSLARY